MARVEPRRDAQGPVTPAASLPLDHPLKYLSLRHMIAIDDALAAIGPFGEVRLVMNRGKLRFIQTVKSEDLGSGEELGTGVS